MPNVSTVHLLRRRDRSEFWARQRIYATEVATGYVLWVEDAGNADDAWWLSTVEFHKNWETLDAA